jgi:hypothetical protein
MVAAKMTASQLDRWFYTFMAVVFAGAAVVGFTPNSLAILAGTKETPPLIIHFHAMAMSSWLMLLSVQAALVGSGNLHIHRRLGMVSVGLAPIVIVIMITLAFPLFQGGEHTYGAGVIQIKRVTLFTAFYAWAFIARKQDTEAHKRLMFLATLVVLDAAFNRMRFLPKFGFENTMAVRHAYELLLLVPLFTYDMLKFGRIHRVYVIGTPIIIAFSMLASYVW